MSLKNASENPQQAEKNVIVKAGKSMDLASGKSQIILVEVKMYWCSFIPYEYFYNKSMIEVIQYANTALERRSNIRTASDYQLFFAKAKEKRKT